jgi:hypothetical protein
MIAARKNPFIFPASPAKLNLRHPALRGGLSFVRMAVVAGPGPGATDLLTQRVANLTGAGIPPTTLGYEVSNIGPVIFPSANVAATSHLGLPAPVAAGESLAQFTLAVIFKARTFGVGQGLIGTDVAGPLAKIQTTNTPLITGTVSGTNLWTANAAVGHDFFVVFAFNVLQPGPKFRSIATVLDMTTGGIQTLTAQGGSTTAGGTYNLVSYDVAGGVNNGMFAAGFLSLRAVPPEEQLVWAQNPFGLWYDDQAPNLMGFAGTKPSVIIQRANPAALMMGV